MGIQDNNGYTENLIFKMIRNIAEILGIILLVVACKAPEKTSLNEFAAPLSASQKGEYNYALTEATKQKIFGNFKQAATLYQKCIEVNPRSDAAYFQLAGILLTAGNLDEAKALNMKAIQINPGNYWYKIQMGQIYLMHEDVDSAIMVYEEIVGKWPEKIETQYELARLYSEAGSSKKAIRLLNKIEKDNGLSEPVSLLKEQVYMLEGKPDLAEKEMLQLIELYPEEIRYLGILAELYTTTGEKEKALRVYTKIFEIEPENGGAQLSIAEFYRLSDDPVNQFVYLEKAMANNYLEIDRKIVVIIDLLTQEELYRKYKTEIFMLIKVLEDEYPGDYRVLTVKADYLTKAEKYAEAIDIYNTILKEHKGNYYIWEQSIVIENILGNSQAVYDKCNEALSYFSDRAVLYLLMGNAATQLGKNHESIKILEKGIEYARENIPLTVQFYSFMAEAWRNEKKYDRSDEYFEKAIEIEPENLMILNNYSYYLSLRGVKLKEAERMSYKTIVMEPENYTYLDTYGWIIFKSGKYEKAKEIIESAMKNGGDKDPDILEHYGDILNSIGMKKEARIYWIKAKECGSTSETLGKKLAELNAEKTFDKWINYSRDYFIFGSM